MLFTKLSSSLSSPLPFLPLGLILGLGIATTNPATLLANAGEVPRVSQPHHSVAMLAQTTSPTSPLADGIYLYGQSPKPEQIGQEYLVFKVQKGEVTGAFYLPKSEFSCFSGSLATGQMNLSVIDPYDNTVSPYSIALQKSSSVATNGQISSSFGLEGYSPINTVSKNDYRILNVCLQKKN